MIKATKSAPAKPKRMNSKTSEKTEVPQVKSTLEFYLDDFSRTLFPLKTTRVIIQNGETEIKSFIDKCLDDTDKSFSFSAQRRVYASKPDFHLRRTVKLDPVAEYYIYDLIYRNRALFRKSHTKDRAHYGYRFENGTPIAPTTAYKDFKGALSEHSKKFKHFMSFDVASYFNTIYHHDLVSWFSELGAPENDVSGLNQLLRQINSGRSVDCLPQGLYPTKMIGNDLLRFIDNYHELKSEKLARFMDDFYLFSDDERKIADDFQLIQRLLGERGLSINPQKTRRDAPGHVRMDSDIDAVKKGLLKRRRMLITIGYDDDERVVQEVMLKSPLNDTELGYITDLLNKPNLEEEDAELILTIMGDHTRRVEGRLPYIISEFPNLTKNVFSFCARIEDRETLAFVILSEVQARDRLMEFQLFWFCAMLDEYLMNTSLASALISAMFYHRSATPITKAKILEIPDSRFGLLEMRNDYLGSGQSDWLAWSSAVGSMSLKRLSRNHKLDYFANSSQMNRLIADVVSKLE